MRTQPAKARRSRYRREARRAILDATEQLLIEEGSEEFSIRKLSARCGFAPPSIYHYFRDKDGLIDALLEERFRELVRQVRRVEPSDDPGEYLRSLALAFVSFGLENQTFYRLLMSTARDGRDRRVPAAEEARALLRRPLLELAHEGRLYSSDVDAVEHAVVALLHGLTALPITWTRERFSKQLNAIAIDALVRGLVRAESSLARSPGAES